MNTNFAKLIALAIVGGVAKALFGPPPAPRVIQHINNDETPSLYSSDKEN